MTAPTAPASAQNSENDFCETTEAPRHAGSAGNVGSVCDRADAQDNRLCEADWGRTTYAEALARQEALVAQRIAGEIADTLVFTEHEPVFTLGRRTGAEQHLLWSEAERTARGITLAQTSRGGDITYHGPGQIVGYPIVSLDTRRDLHAYLRFLEQVLINTVGALGLAASRRPGLTGIWIGERKVAAIGVAVKRWVAYHGFALNLAPDLAHFGGIVPCGIAPTQGSVTSLSAELSAAGLPCPSAAEVKRLLASEFCALWHSQNAPPTKPASVRSTRERRAASQMPRV
ncbi:lipoyl(octanoyl) transferase LipB [Cephaloticoccus capnophilus]|uniref:lipoyl(octanoyl) transferase LipB n=1 Tax=Cephaloticoccus capnophilus TaxID=1548208 RepID=UPI0009EECAFC|nr:lipoyl(octanoyl) transferase LipB [Cephaloticoccus capnophilus]